MSNLKQAVKIVPKLRFPEFSDEWQSKKPEYITKINQGLQIPISDRLTREEPNSYFYITNEFIKQGSAKKYFIKNPNESVIADKEDLLMTRTGNTGIVVTGIRGVFHNNFFKIKRDKDQVSKGFLYYFLTSEITQRLILRLAGNSTIPDLNHGDFYKILINIPSIKEQEKIAGFLTAVVEKINILEQKLKLMQKYKKGLMQQIFSQKLRFKDANGQNYPSWQTKKLGEISDITTGKLDANEMSSKGKYRFYTCAKDYYMIDEYAFDTEALLISGNGANVGYIHYYKGKFNAYQRTYVLNNFTESIFYIKQFLDEFLSKRIFQEKFDGSMPYIVLSTLKDMLIDLPTITEQNKIADYLMCIDEKIESEERMLEKAKKFKKALLQQMFV